MVEGLDDGLGENEVFVAIKSGNIRYLSRADLTDPIASAIVIGKDGKTAIVSSLEKNRASEMLDMEMKVYSPYPRVKKDARTFLSLLRGLCAGKRVVSDARIDGLRTQIEDRVTQMRIVKSDAELNKIKKANRITKGVDLGSIVVGGRSEMEIARAVDDAMLRGGAGGFAFDTIVACERHTSYSHHQPAGMKYRSAAIVDFGARYKGYCADLTRTVIEGNERLLKIRERIDESIASVVDEFGEGSRCADMDRGLRRALGTMSKRFYHSTGHGIGLDVHEAPSISVTSKDVLRRNMVFTIEPGVYIKGVGGVRVEDDFYVSDRIRRI
jgi:Xaa-Pro dipeptidase